MKEFSFDLTTFGALPSFCLLNVERRNWTLAEPLLRAFQSVTSTSHDAEIDENLHKSKQICHEFDKGKKKFYCRCERFYGVLCFDKLLKRFLFGKRFSSLKQHAN